jgi:type I restriction enzyme S subunit
LDYRGEVVITGGDPRGLRIGEIAENLNRIRVPLSGLERKSREGPYRYYGAQGVIDYIDDYLFEGEYVLVAEDGENLRSRKQPIAFLVSGKFWVNNHAHVLKVRDNAANSRFVVHAINQASLAGLITGAAQPKLTKANLERLRLPGLSKNEQDRVAGVLAAFDELIEINERRIALLEGVARSLYREWFARIPETSGDSGDGVRMTTIAEVAEQVKGSTNPSKHPEAQYEHFSIPAFDAGRLPLREYGVAIRSNKTTLAGECVLLSKLNPRIPRVWFASPETARAVASTEFLPWRGRAVSNSWLWAAFSDDEFQRRLIGAAGGTSTSHQRVKPRDVATYPIPRPDPEHLQAFDATAEPSMREAAVLRRSNRGLVYTRDLLLPRLVTGRLDISDVDFGDMSADETFE